MEYSCCGITVEDGCEVKLKVSGRASDVVIDELSGLILVLIGREGSILGASRMLGIPYSRVWDRINRIESRIGERLIEVARGRKGARLTRIGEFIAGVFENAYRSVHGRVPHRGLSEGELASRVRGGEGSAVVYAGSNDYLVEEAVKSLVRRGASVKVYWIGSLNGVASIMLGEANVAGIHLKQGNKYNVWVAENLVKDYDIVLVKGYLRSIGFALRTPLSIKEVIEGLISGRLVLANRNVGSGARRLLEDLICQYLGRASCVDIYERIRGWETEFATYDDVARAITLGMADVGIVIEHVALNHDLYYSRIGWEEFDFLVRKSEESRILLDAICEKARRVQLSGYRVLSDSCSVIGSVQ